MTINLASGNFYCSGIRHGIFRGLIFGPGISLGFLGSSRDSFVFLVFPPFDHTHNLKSREEKGID